MKWTRWTAEQDAQLKLLWLDGHSSGSIAARLDRGLSRNAIVGRLHRLGLMKSRATTKRYVRQSRAQREAGKKVRIPQPLHMPDMTVPAAKPARLPADPPALGALVSFDALEAGMCRFPSGDVGKPGFGFCGRQSIPQQSYCPHHHAIAWVAPIRTKKPVPAAVRAAKEDA